MPRTAIAIQTIARFLCGCIYATGRGTEPLICPQHQQIRSGKETIRHGREREPQIARLARHPKFPTVPVRLEDNERNSLNAVTKVVWSDGDEEEIERESGLCNACYAERGDTVQARTGRCGCPNPECELRWCGRISGLHAFFGMHVRSDYGKLRDEENGNEIDLEIFCYGSEQDSPEDWQEALRKERSKVEQAVIRWTAKLREKSRDPVTEAVRGLTKAERERRVLGWLIMAGAIGSLGREQQGRLL